MITEQVILCVIHIWSCIHITICKHRWIQGISLYIDHSPSSVTFGLVKRKCSKNISKTELAFILIKILKCTIKKFELYFYSRWFSGISCWESTAFQVSRFMHFIHQWFPTIVYRGFLIPGTLILRPKHWKCQVQDIQGIVTVQVIRACSGDRIILKVPHSDATWNLGQ